MRVLAEVKNWTGHYHEGTVQWWAGHHSVMGGEQLVVACQLCGLQVVGVVPAVHFSTTGFLSTVIPSLQPGL